MLMWSSSRFFHTADPDGSGKVLYAVVDQCPRGSHSIHFCTSLQKYTNKTNSLFGWLVADGWCWFVLREEYCWLVAGGWFVVREKYCWLVADKSKVYTDKSK
jgi:hypothetical protein